MDGQTMTSAVKILIFLPLVLVLAYITLKIGGGRFMGMSGGRIIKIVERVPLSNKSFLCIVVIGGKPYVISSTEEKIELLMELPEEALKEREGEKTASFKESLLSNLNQLINRGEKP